MVALDHTDMKVDHYSIGPLFGAMKQQLGVFPYLVGGRWDRAWA